MICFKYLMATCAFLMLAPTIHAEQTFMDRGDTVPSSVGAALLGHGYDSHRVAFNSTCVQLAPGATVEYSGTQTATVRLDKRLTYDQLKSLLEVEVKGKLKFGTFNTSGGSKFISDAASTDLSESVIFATNIRGKTAIFNDVVLSPLGEKMAKTNEAQAIRNTCGDQYVYGAELGSQLLVNVKFEFANRRVKADFNANIKFNMVDLFSVEGRAKVFSEKFKKHVSITISAVQVGGNVAKLTRIFGNAGESGVPVMQCSLKRPEECQKAMEAIIAYARGDYADQLRNLSYDPKEPQGAAFLGYLTRSYARGGGNLPDLYRKPGPVLDLEIEAARDRLEAQYEVLKRHRTRSSRLLLLDSLNTQERELIASIDATIKSNTKQLINAATICYDSPDECLAAEQAYEPKEYDPASLVHRMTFLDYCLLSGISKATDHTIKELRQYLSLPKASCQEVEKAINLVETLHLTTRQISDVAPLAGLDRLINLDLGNNKVIDIKPLKTLPKLEKLNLRYNTIGSLEDLATMTQLKELNLGFNQIVSIKPLSNLVNLEVLKLHGNDDIVDYSPIDGITFDVLFKTGDDICEYERDWVYGLGKVSPEDYEFYKDVNFAPRFARPGDHSSAIEGWFNCIVVVTDY